VAIQIGCVIAYRIYINKSVFREDGFMAFVVGDFGSVIISLISIVILENVSLESILFPLKNSKCFFFFLKSYKYIAYKLTKWEIPRTKSEFDTNYTVKLFAFEFINCYGSFFYIAFFRQVSLIGKTKATEMID
jgi:hypothetical protein